MAFGDAAVYIDVKIDADQLAQMLRLSGGKRQVPVIIENDKVTVGFGGS